MKNILVLSLLVLGSYSALFAQEKSGVKSVIGAASSRKDNLIVASSTQLVNGVSTTFTISSVSINVGMPYMGLSKGATVGAASTQNYNKDLGFPWGIRYVYNTFSEDAFTVSKGYFSDKIEINWDIKNNLDRIISLSIYRTEDITSAYPTWGKPLKIVAKDAGTYIDNDVEGGKLYRYKIFAKGIEVDNLEILYSNFITGIGYRNPTGVITGNIAYTGGNPVKDVVIVANPTGSTLRFGSSLIVPANSYISVPGLKKGLRDSITLQTWIKPSANFSNEELTLYNLLGSGIGESLIFKIKLGLVSGKNVLTASVGSQVITLSDYIPSGEIDNKGDDILVPITNINSSFTHFSTVLRHNQVPEIYINGRAINASYITKMNAILDQNPLTAPTNIVFTNTNTAVSVNYVTDRATWLNLKMGGGKLAYFDELRVWETALSASQIQRDYRRYLKGNEAALNTYIQANEKVGDFAYDLAHTGYVFHGNNAKLSSSPVTPSWANSEDDLNNIPTSSQLGILGISDEFGNYVISSVPYSGNGDAYTIVPSLGKHEFNPKQELSFLGIGSTVINNVDFVDKSSFVFKGLAVYDSRGVFPRTSDPVIKGDIKDNEVYNAYTKGNLKYQKGEYWAVKNSTGGVDSLVRYAPIPIPGAFVNIDNAPAIDANNVPVQTDINGRFSIEVPIGKHAITINKSGHTFLYEGRYPAKTSQVIAGDTIYTNTYQDFFEDRDEAVTFIDTTKVFVVGRIVGGNKQADQIIGFGFDGKKTDTTTDANGITRYTTYTSINNIGKARISLGYMPAGATSVTPEYRTSFETHIQTGEFRVPLLPLEYLLYQNDLVFTSGVNPNNAPLLNEGKTLNFNAIKALQYPTFVQGNKTITGKQPYQEVLKFTYVATPTHNVIKQTADSIIKIGATTYTYTPLLPYNASTIPVYTQFADYSIQIQGQEKYYNYDNSLTAPAISTVPVEGGAIVATNNLALENSEKFEISNTDPSITIYSFKGGTPNTDSVAGYKRTLNLRYSLNGVEKPIDNNYYTQGVVLGGVADGTQTFVTAGPQLPDFILRDPPGSESSATIEKGSSFSFTKESSSSKNNSSELNATVSLGFNLTLGGGLLGPVMKTQVTNDVSTGVTMAQSSSNGNSVTNTYSFNQTISTSDNPSWVGSDADLYIGSSANQFYGTYNQLALATTGTASRAINVKNGTANAVLYPKLNKAMYFNEAPEKTLFVYSQYNILNEVIPKYLDILKQIDSGKLIENTNGVLSKNTYNSSINLWRKIILNNELAKYRALNNKDSLKTSLNAIIESLKDPATNTLSPSAKKLKDLLNATFFENISLDAGVGAFTKGYQIERLTSNTLSYQLQLDQSVALAFGAAFNETGFEMDTKTNSGSGNTSTSGDNNNETSNISYTLRDSDKGNLLSVDVINAFDGNGPIFVTKGGETSCPYEGAELSHFYNPTHTNVTNTTTPIVNLTETQRVPLSLATMALEIPEITVLNSSVSGIFEGRNAEFVLQLRNTSTINKDATFKLLVDQSTNPDNALINIEPNGTFINIPAGRTVSYTMTLKKVKQDQFSYPNIRVILASICDDNAVDSLLVSATFIPACSPVSIITPSNNWLLNRNNAYDSAKTLALNIKLGDYNANFANFKQINLDYRLKGTPNWIGLSTYFKNQTDLNIAKAGGDSATSLINAAQVNYAWDIAAKGLANGSYELRARTTCINQTAYESEIIVGNVDLTAPVLFSTPTPRNGILNLGDDISLRFNEPVKKNGTVTKFEFLIQKNQLPLKHEVSVAFNGTNNTATINKPAITTGDFSIEFWLKNMSPSDTTTLLSQDGGIKIQLVNNQLKYTIGGQNLITTITKDSTFNYYALSYEAATRKLSIFENSTAKNWKIFTTPLVFTNENPIIIGGGSFKGNLHDLRFWKKVVTMQQAVINMNTVFSGNELGLIGYWPMDEGNGIMAHDLARFKHITLAKADWDIFPKGTAYNFDGSNYLKLDSSANVVISKDMDATVSFWMKSNQTTIGTLMSNGWDDSNDPIESNGYRNKWSITLNATGTVDLKAEAKVFSFGGIKVNDNSWHHIAMSLTRNGTVRMYIDGNETASYPSIDLGGFNASIIRLGTQSFKNTNNTYPLINYFNGQMDEFCIWNMARNAEQIKADQFNEVNFNTTGLLLYTNLNKPETSMPDGPKYYYPLNSTEKKSAYASLIKPLAYTDITPGIKPFRPTESMVVDAVINGDEIMLKPAITNWASAEGKVAYITVSGVNDLADNRQASPITWTAYINKNPVKWFVEGQGENVNLMKRTNAQLVFEITLINQGGVEQPFSIDLPTWLTLSNKSGTIAPNSTLTFKATVDSNLAVGNYNTVLALTTNYGFNNKIQLDVRVLEKEPILKLDPSKFSQSMNIIGRIKLDSVFSDDIYDKVVAIVNGEVRGMNSVMFDASFNEYFVFLTVYSNTITPENIMFYIWDASDGKLKEATLNNQYTIAFTQDQILGTFNIPVVFRNTAITGQQIPFNEGWTWASFNVQDGRFGSLNNLTKTMALSTSDLIQSNAPALFDAYQYNPLDSAMSGWSGSVSDSGGIKNNKMYKVKLAKAQSLNIKGVPVDLSTWQINLNQYWNWLPFVVSKNTPIGDALANFKASEGDLIKSQSSFAIYTTPIGWKGTLTYLKAGEGYMLKTNIAQTLTYPAYLNVANNKAVASTSVKQSSISNVASSLNAIVTEEYAKYASTMSAIVKLPEGFNNVSFYNADGVLRGNSQVQNIDGIDLAFITIYGNKPEMLTAYIGADKSIQATSKTFGFSPDAILGSIHNPIIIELPALPIRFSPNPFSAILEIAFASKEVGDAKILVYNMISQKVFETDFKIIAGANILKIQPNIPAGAYIVQVQIGERVVFEKVIKN